MFNYLLTRPANTNRSPTQPRAIILAPTRELAIQIHRDAVTLGKYVDFKLRLDARDNRRFGLKLDLITKYRDLTAIDFLQQVGDIFGE